VKKKNLIIASLISVTLSSAFLLPSCSSGGKNFIRIKSGTFTMGSPSSEPEREDNEALHQVKVSGFSMGKYEVTQAEYEAVMGANPSEFKGANLPVGKVSWFDAVRYCIQRSEQEGLASPYTLEGDKVTWDRKANGYRLPTEAEWEYACRAGTTTPFSTGSSITTDQANYNGEYPYNNYPEGKNREKTIEVGSFEPNYWGLYDMHGNAFEWCWDWYGEYSVGNQTDPMGAASGIVRVVRGGSSGNDASSLRSAFRGRSAPSGRFSFLGFRLVRP
jgi:formylglycine-generating enzyme required for sulfatase activity